MRWIRVERGTVGDGSWAMTTSGGVGRTPGARRSEGEEDRMSSGMGKRGGSSEKKGMERRKKVQRRDNGGGKGGRGRGRGFVRL